MSNASPDPVDVQLPADARVAVVAARFNGHITDELLAGCVRRLDELGLTREHVEVHRVPGAFELPVAARVLAQTKRFSAVICLGCVVRGDTPHFDYVAGECARGIQQVAITECLPVIFGVLTTNTEQQALDRAGLPGSGEDKGYEAAVAALATAVTLASFLCC